MILQEYQFDTIYKKGKTHVNADALLRNLVTNLETSQIENILDPTEQKAIIRWAYDQHNHQG